MQKKISRTSPTEGLTRRKFIKRTTLAATAAMYFPYVGKVLGANDRINVACIGVGGKGDQDSTDAALNGANVVAVCDVDETSLGSKVYQFQKNFPDLKPKAFKDYREMFDKISDQFDAVTVSTPDHHHGCAGIRALKHGKHLFCQKPLMQTINETRVARALAREKKLATQMGNQGSAASGLRRAVEVLHAGIIGNPLELHVWSNRPIWPQGQERPSGEDPLPEVPANWDSVLPEDAQKRLAELFPGSSSLDWDLWLGPAQPRPFKNWYEHISRKSWAANVYHPRSWRGWQEFGTGALGDMACHTVNMPFRGLKLGYPNVVELELCSRLYPEQFPKTSKIRYEFPAREGLPPLKFWWYDGNPNDELKPLRPEADVVHEIVAANNNLPGSGALIIGDKGKLFSPDDYGTEFYLCMKGEDMFTPADKHDAVKAVPMSIPRLAPLGKGGDTTTHMSEWFTMMKDGTPSYSNFEIAGYLAEVILLGCVALRCGEGKRMEWDGPNMTSPNLPEAAHFVKRDNRQGWDA
jgi:hypothetical protein